MPSRLQPARTERVAAEPPATSTGRPRDWRAKDPGSTSTTRRASRACRRAAAAVSSDSACVRVTTTVVLPSMAPWRSRSSWPLATSTGTPCSVSTCATARVPSGPALRGSRGWSLPARPRTATAPTTSSTKATATAASSRRRRLRPVACCGRPSSTSGRSHTSSVIGRPLRWWVGRGLVRAGVPGRGPGGREGCVEGDDALRVGPARLVSSVGHLVEEVRGPVQVGAVVGEGLAKAQGDLVGRERRGPVEQGALGGPLRDGAHGVDDGGGIPSLAQRQRGPLAEAGRGEAFPAQHRRGVGTDVPPVTADVAQGEQQQGDDDGGHRTRHHRGQRAGGARVGAQQGVDEPLDGVEQALDGVVVLAIHGRGQLVVQPSARLLVARVERAAACAATAASGISGRDSCPRRRPRARGQVEALLADPRVRVEKGGDRRQEGLGEDAAHEAAAGARGHDGDAHHGVGLAPASIEATANASSMPPSWSARRGCTGRCR